jgi:hypothetical protein
MGQHLFVRQLPAAFLGHARQIERSWLASPDRSDLGARRVRAAFSARPRRRAFGIAVLVEDSSRPPIPGSAGTVSGNELGGIKFDREGLG